MSSDLVLEFDVALQAPPSRVFAALTEGRHLERWFCDACESEPREAGRLTMRWLRSGSPIPYEATWLEFAPHERAAYRGGHAGYPNGDAGTITFTLEPDGDGAPAGVGTRLRVTHAMGDPLFYSDLAETYRDAWPRALRRLGDYLAPRLQEMA